MNDIEYYFYYYIRNSENHPVITVCIGILNGEYYRGVAICSELDNFDYETGRKIAYHRMLRATRTPKRDSLEIKRNLQDLLEHPAMVYEFGEKSGSKVNLTLHEHRLLKLA